VTAEAVAAVAVVGSAVDVVAGRRLVATGLADGSARAYWVVACLAAAMLFLVAGAMSRPRLLSPSIGFVAAMFAAVSAAVSPTTVDGFAWLGLAAAAAGAVMSVAADLLPVDASAVRAASSTGSAAAAGLGVMAGLVAASDGTTGAWAGVAIAAGLLLTPAAGLGGAGLVALAFAAGGVPSGASAVALVAAGVIAAAGALLARQSSVSAVGHRVADAVVGAAVVVEVVEQVRLQMSAVGGADLVPASVGMAVLVGASAIGAARRADWASLLAPAAVVFGVAAATELGAVDSARTAAAVAVVVALATMAAGVVLARREVAVTALVLADIAWLALMQLDGTTTLDSRFALPALTSLLIGAADLVRDSARDSWVLGPGLALALLPSLLLALHGDSARQAVVVVVGAMIAATGGFLRLRCPLALGAASVLLVVVRVVGPDVVALPRWLSLGLVGVALLATGATWERRLENVRRVRSSLVADLR
jgi:hypothetical protein